MMVIVSGANRVEFCTVTRKEDFHKAFFATRGQLYFIPTNGMVRMRVTEFGKQRPSEAVMAYEENSIFPYDMKDIEYKMDNFLCDIDRYKKMTDYSWFRGREPIYFTNVAKNLWKWITTPMGITAAVVLYIFLTGGFTS